MKFQVYSRLTLFGRRWYWRLRARNNEIIAQGETNGYRNRGDCVHTVELIRDGALMAPVEVLP
jgi:uncharacterized protein YegP (UPF0339 family)